MKNINLSRIGNTLSDEEMKNVIGGLDPNNSDVSTIDPEGGGGPCKSNLVDFVCKVEFPGALDEFKTMYREGSACTDYPSGLRMAYADVANTHPGARVTCTLV